MGKKDITLKDYFSDCRRYADLLNGSVFCGQQMVKAEELREADTVQSKSDSFGVLERTNDIAMKQTKHGNIFAVWVVANQEKQSDGGFAGSGEFLSGIKKEDRPYPVITLVVYWGEEKWQGAENLHDMIQFGEDKAFADTLKALVPKYPLHFLNLSQVHDYRDFHSEIRMLFEL